MTGFYETRAGRQFYESTMPRIAEELTRLNSNLGVLVLLLTDLGKERSRETPESKNHSERCSEHNRLDP